MSTLDPTLDPNIDRATRRAAEDVTAAPSIVGVLTTSDHKVIGRMFIGSSLLGLVIVGVLGVVLGLERIDGDDTLVKASTLTQLFAGYRVGLVEAAVLPLLLGVCVLAVPLQLGARSLAFPRVTAAGFWAWFAGIVLVIVALANNGGPFGGNADMVSLYLAANALALTGLTAVAVTVATSVLTTRAPGMRMSRVPLFSWGALIASLGLVLVLPVAVGVHIYLYVDYQYTQSAFGAANGIFDWTFYLLTGPVLALFALPAIGFVAELVPVVLRKRLPLRDVAIAGLGLVGVAALAGVAQQDVINVPWRGDGLSLEHIRPKIGDLITFGVLVLLPLLGVLVVLGVAAFAAKPATQGAKAAKPNLIAPFLIALPGLLLIVLGMAATALNSIDDLGLQGTVFEEGATVAIAYGGAIAGLGAIAYWIPKLTGRTLQSKQIGGPALLAVAGAALASIPYLIAGFLDQPASAATYNNDGPGEALNGITMVGHGLVALAVLLFAGLVVSAFVGRGGKSGSDAAGDNPWSGHTLEWTTPSPAPTANFATTPTVMSPEPVLDLTAAPDFAQSERAQAGEETVGQRGRA